MTQHPAKTLLIVGGGHASLPLIKMGKKWKKYNITIKLLSAHPFLIYSGSLPQFMGGFYNWEQTAVNLEYLCDRYGTQFMKGTAVSIKNEEKSVTTTDGLVVHYDYLLVNIGASTKSLLEGDNISPVKPMPKLLELKTKLKNGTVKKLLILGGGAAGSELALNFSHPTSDYPLNLTIADKNNRLLNSFPKKLSRQVTGILQDRGVTVITGERISYDYITDFEHIVVATGNQPRAVTINHTFKTGNSGRILTENTLQVAGESCVFAAGDTADVGGNNYQQIGVHAVKQGVLLRDNLKSVILGEKLKTYKPYIFNPLIISNGPDSAFFVTGKLCVKGRLYSLLKHVLDMRWIEKYQKEPDERKSDLELFRQAIKRSR